MSEKLDQHVALLEQAGFVAAAKDAKDSYERAGRLAQAYEHYRYVSQEKINDFNNKLYAETLRRTGKAGKDLVEHYDCLVFDAVDSYPGIPPMEVLESTRQAAGRGIFDTLEVAHVVSVREYKDPIIFGRVTGCTDRFFIAQWGDDVRITDLVGTSEG